MAGVTALVFAAVAFGNELALRDRLAASSRFGPTDPDLDPPPCDGRLETGRSARLELHLTGDVDGRPIGQVDLAGSRDLADFRWLAYIATPRELSFRGAARIGERAWIRPPGAGWQLADPRSVANLTVDRQARALTLNAGVRATAEEHGLALVEGARARHCRVAVDGATFRLAFPEVAWLVGDASLDHWRGELDYWVFADGEIGRMTGSVNGDAVDIDPDALQGTVRLTLIATDRGASLAIAPPR
jgi:hypothetical protein